MDASNEKDMRCIWQSRAFLMIMMIIVELLLLMTLEADCTGVESATLADDWYAFTRCNEASSSMKCRHYERCKATHRCARGDEDYAIKAAQHSSYTREFAGGTRSQIALMNDFEDWKTGTHGWKFNQDNDTIAMVDIGWNTFDFNVIDSLELSVGYLVFDTDSGELKGDANMQGVITTTRQGTSVAVFNFMTVYLGKDVKVRFQGNRAISIMSRSSMIIDTELKIRPGTLGGFPGGGFIGAGNTNNNRNGPGSTNVRVYVKTISTSGTHIPEIQEIETSAAPGQKLQGHFILSWGATGLQTEPIRYDATSHDVRRYLETTFPDIGSLNVERDDTLEQVPEIGRLWRVTFLTAVGNVDQLCAKSLLSGLSSQVVTRTLRDGNQLSGSFQLQFLEYETRPLPHNITAKQMEIALLEDFEFLIDARVARTDPLGQCLQGSTEPDQSASTSIGQLLSEDLYQSSEWLVPNEKLVEDSDSVKNYGDKLCASGRGTADTYVWKIQFWTRAGNAMPYSPTSPTANRVDIAAPLTVDYTQLNGIGASAEVVDSLCFSLAFGGAGALFGGKGGDGYAAPYRVTYDYATTYSDQRIPDLLGGSGGAGGGMEPIDVFPVVQPTLGGAGAGAIMLSAVNDILIGHNGRISVNGGPGSSAFTAGGGGAGGSILIIAGGSVAHHGLLEAVGGRGGSSISPSTAGGGGSGGRIAIYAQTLSAWGDGMIDVRGGVSQESTRAGGHGTSYIRVHTNLVMRVDPSLGAAGTAKSLLVDGSENYESRSRGISSTHSHQFSRSGPQFTLSSPSQPTRISYFVSIGNFVEGKIINNRGAIFGIHSAGENEVIDDMNRELMIGIGIIDGSFNHGANTFQWPRHVFQEKIQPNRWYKVDVLINWDLYSYSIHLNDILKVSNVSFQGDFVGAISLNNVHSMSTWWDEIYVGDNHLMDFECPFVKKIQPDTSGEENGRVVVKKRLLRKLWAMSFQKPSTTYHPMTRHESHLSKRKVYTEHDNGGMIPFDGEPHREYFNDIRELESETPDGTGEEDFDADLETLSAAELLTTENLLQDSTIILPLETGADYATLSADMINSSQTIHAANHPSVYWYSEIFNETTMKGGIGACSTVDYNEWRNEGIVLHFVNLTNPFGVALGDLLADRPKVIFNLDTSQFVMWMHVDNENNSIGLSGVATSTYPNGPFAFEGSFYPDAPLEAPGGQSINETHDQTIAILAPTPDRSDRLPTAFLLRTYYKTIEYWLPRPVMDPLWQSVQTSEAETDFGLSYHRAFYHPGYDDPSDIYLQRWRMEDVPWELICCEPTNLTDCVSYTVVPTTNTSICPDGKSKKHIIGQAQTASPVTSRYKDPNVDANSYFLPQSVRSHTSWGFQVYNVKTWRGNYFDALSTNITDFIFHRFAGKTRRLEIESDPTIQYQYPNEEELTQHTILTNDTAVLDELLGTLGVPVSTEFKQAYSSYDLAEIDIDSNNKITSYEIASLQLKLESGTLTSTLVDSLMANYETMKWNQVDILDANSDGEITFPEFEAWVGLDPDLVFDKFDLDKNGYLDENELARTMWYRQVPRLDYAIILLDPDFDGRIYHSRFLSLLLKAPDYIFTTYDLDSSTTLTDDEIDLMITDLGSAFANRSVLESLKDSTSKSIKQADYVQWFSATTSLVNDARNALKVDNAVHATRPDSLTGPMHVVERRRAKYIAISRLTGDYLATEGLLKEIEGDFEGREALLNYFAFTEDLFGLTDEDFHVNVDTDAQRVAFREFLSPLMLYERASYWNGRHWEGRPSAPVLFTYGSQCLQVAGTDSADSGCLPCATRSPYVTSAIDEYQSKARDTSHCAPQKELDAYIKDFDQQVAIQLQYQQQSQYNSLAGLQPHMSPCFNQTQVFPCDVHKIFDGNVADSLRNMSTRTTPWNIAWENHPNNVGSSVKIRADDNQQTSMGPTFLERFPVRLREPLDSDEPLDTLATYAPDQLTDILGGGT